MWKCRKYHKSIEIPKPKSRTHRRYSIFACWTIITCNSFIAFEFGISPHLRPQFSEIRLRIDMTGEYEPSRLKYIANHNNAALSSKPINTFVKIEPFLNMCQAMRRVYISKGFVVLVIRQSKRIKKNRWKINRFFSLSGLPLASHTQFRISLYRCSYLHMHIEAKMKPWFRLHRHFVFGLWNPRAIFIILWFVLHNSLYASGISVDMFVRIFRYAVWMAKH